MQRPPGFKSKAQADNFHTAALDHRRGGPLAPICGARTRTGTICTQVPLDGGARCLRHAGPDAARAHRERQLAGLRTGRVSPEAFARAEARRARNALDWGWRKDPRLPGATIDLEPDLDRFVEAASALGVDVDGLFPAVRDWLAWRWRRTQADRRDDAKWGRIVRVDLPRRIADADAAVALADLGITDWRTKTGRAVRAALRAGGMTRARDVLAAIRAAEAQAAPAAGRGKVADGRPKPLTALPVKPWTARPAEGAWKRHLPDKPRAAKALPAAPKPLGRPRQTPDSADELAALGQVLREAGPQVRVMFDAIPGQADQLRFLRELAEYTNAPDNAGAFAKWFRWVGMLA